MGRGQLLVFVLAFAPKVFAYTQSVTDSQARLEKLASEAQEAQRARDYRRAAGCFEEILKLEPGFPEMRANLGLMHHLLGEYPDAIQDFKTALKQKPNLFAPNLFLGLDLIQTNQPGQAVPFLLRAQRLDPHNLEAVKALAQAHFTLRNYDAAAEWHQRATELDPLNADAWYGLGVSHLRLQEMAVTRLGQAGLSSPYFQLLLAQSLEQQGRLDDAIGTYKKVLASKIDIPCVRTHLGYARVLTGDAKTAEGEFNTDLLAGNPCQAARLGLARAKFQQDEFEEGLADVSRAWNADSRFVEENAGQLWRGIDSQTADTLKSRLGGLNEKGAEAGISDFLLASMEGHQRKPPSHVAAPTVTLAGDTSLAEDTAEQLWAKGHYTLCARKLSADVDKLSTGDLLLLAQCSYYSGAYATVSMASNRVLRARGQDQRALYWLVKAEEKLAVDSLIQAGLAAPQSPRVHLLLGDLYRDMRNYKDAEGEYRKALQLKPDSAAAHFGLAVTYYRDVRFDKAATEAQEVLNLTPRDPDASFIMAETLVSERQYAEAMTYLEAALKGEPASIPRVHALLSKVYAAQGKNEQAVNELKQALTDDRDGSLHFQLSRLYWKLGDRKAAEAAMQKSEAIRKANAQVDRERIETAQRLHSSAP
jgi:tetratricopeptide (TPR) repeat protein